MKKYILSALLAGLVFPAAALDPLFVHSVKPPQGCIDKDITNEELSLQDLLQISICTNPSLSAQYMGVKAAEANLGTGRAEYLPTVVITGNGNISGDRIEGQDHYVQTEPYAAAAKAEWLLFDFGGREARSSALKAYFEAANYTYNAALQDLVLSVQTAYLNLLAAQESLISAKASLDTYKQSYDEAQKRYKLGMVSLSDKLQAKTRYEQAVLTVVLAENKVKQFAGSLAVLLNLTPTTSLKMTSPQFEKTATEIETDDVNVLLQEALAKRPELRAQESNEKAAKANLRTARSSIFPSISANAAASLNDTSWKHDTLYKRNNTAGLTVAWPVFTGFSTMYYVQSAASAYQQAQRNTEGLRLAIQNEVWSNYQNYKTAVQAYEISKTVLESAEENHRVAFRYYEVGKTDIISLLSAVAQLANARQNKITAFYDLLLSKANLERSIGKY